MSRFTDALEHILTTIEARKGGDPAASWTAKLLADPKLAAKKLGEEAVELVQASALKDKDAMASEAADVLYHLLALLAAEGVDVDAVAAKLESRQGLSGLAEKAARPK
jgi:phosphoribosyl-ATP pyrophosphohydrolase